MLVCFREALAQLGVKRLGGRRPPFGLVGVENRYEIEAFGRYLPIVHENYVLTFVDAET